MKWVGEALGATGNVVHEVPIGAGAGAAVAATGAGVTTGGTGNGGDTGAVNLGRFPQMLLR